MLDFIHPNSGEYEGDWYWIQFFYITLIELFDVCTVIYGFIALETSRGFSIFSYSKHKRLFFSIGTLEVKVTLYCEIAFYTFTNVLNWFGYIIRLLERIERINGQFLISLSGFLQAFPSIAAPWQVVQQRLESDSFLLNESSITFLFSRLWCSPLSQMFSIREGFGFGLAWVWSRHDVGRRGCGRGGPCGTSVSCDGLGGVTVLAARWVRSLWLSGHTGNPSVGFCGWIIRDPPSQLWRPEAWTRSVSRAELSTARVGRGPACLLQALVAPGTPGLGDLSPWPLPPSSPALLCVSVPTRPSHKDLLDLATLVQPDSS